MTWTGQKTVRFWIKLHYPGHFKRDPAGASLDRKDNRQGYVEDNVIVVSWRANSLRNNATEEELFKLAKFYVREEYDPDFDFPPEFDLDYYGPYSGE